MDIISFLMAYSLLTSPSNVERIFSAQPKNYENVSIGVAKELKKSLDINKVQILNSSSCSIDVSISDETKSDSGCSTLFVYQKKGFTVLVSSPHLETLLELSNNFDSETTQDVNGILLNANSDVKLKKEPYEDLSSGNCSYENNKLVCEIKTRNMVVKINQVVNSLSQNL